MLLDGGLQFKERRVSDRTKKREMTKEKEQSERRTHRLSVRRKMIAHDIGIMGHDVLPSDAIKTVSLNRPREMWRFNELTGISLFLLRFSTIRIHDKQGTGKEEKKKRLSIYLSSNGRHEAGDVEFLIVQSLNKPPDVGNAIPP